jgi:hypothetical protein
VQHQQVNSIHGYSENRILIVTLKWIKMDENIDRELKIPIWLTVGM